MSARSRPILTLAAAIAIVGGACTPSVAPSQTTAPSASPAAASAPPMPVAVGRVRSVDTSDKVVYADQRVAITLHGGYAYHDNDKVVTSGLSNVPVGTDVYLEALAADPAGTKMVSWEWKLEGPAFSAAKLNDAKAQKPKFTADLAGQYVLTVTAKNEKGVSYTSELTVNAGVYAGVQTCATCHNGSVQPDIVGAWEQTNHARHLELVYGSYSATSDYCIGCHTTGYNETDKAKGFDDRAIASGWDKTTSLTEFLMTRKMGLAQVMNAPMGALANIQCEACHGPGGSSHTAVKTLEVGTCAQCHTAQPAGWETSAHALSGRNDMHTAENASCVACHTGEGFLEVTVRGKEPIFPNTATKDKPATLSLPTEQAPIACATCHDPHVATNANEPRAGHSLQLRMAGEVKMRNGATADAEFAATCVACHNDRRTPQYMQEFMDGKQGRSTHDNTQADVLYGAGAYTYGEALSNSAHINTPDACITCHMAPNPVMDPGADKKAGTRDDVKAMNVGNHSMNMSGKYSGLANGQQVKDLLVQNVNGCNTKGCHAGDPLTSFAVKAQGDYDGNGTTQSVQEEVKGILKLIADKLAKDDKGALRTSGITDQNTTREQRQALWNYQLVVTDGSNGIHNPRFVIQLLQTTYRHLTGSDVPNAKILK